MPEISNVLHDVLSFWFGDPTLVTTDYQQQRQRWFQKSPDFDQEIRTRFRFVYDQAIAGELDDWRSFPLGCLALVIVFDQFPRNMFRNQPQAFATDDQALAITQHAIAQGFDQVLPPVGRLFLYLPLEHSEQLVHQHQSVQYLEQLAATAPELTDALDYGYRHRQVIQRFGRFPHRNHILGRTSTPGEVEFLQQPGSRF